MTILPKNLKPSVAGGVLTLAERLIQNRYHWLARPTDTMVVDHVDLIAKRVYLRRTDDQAAHNEYPYPYDTSLSFAPGDVVTVQWTSTGPYVVGGGVPASPPVTGGGTTVTEPNLEVLDTNSVDLSVADDTTNHAAQISADVRLDPAGALQTTAAGVGAKVDGTTVQIVGDVLTAPGGGGGGSSSPGAGAGTMLTISTLGSWPSTVNQAISWDEVYQDTTSGAMYSAAHPTRLTAPRDGWYMAGTHMGFQVNSPGAGAYFNLAIRAFGDVPGGDNQIVGEDEAAYDFHDAPESPVQTAQVTVPIFLHAGDYVESWLRWNGGGTVEAQSGYQVAFDPDIYAPEEAYFYLLATGGGPTGPGAALYELSNDFFLTAGGSFNPIPWDTFVVGDNVYLDPTHTDGLTIPAGGGGDYALNCQVWFQSGGPISTFWSVEWWLTVEIHRAGSVAYHIERQDLYQQAASDQYWEYPAFAINATLPALQAGDVVKTNFSLQNSGGTSFGSQRIWGGDDHTWVSIAPIGSGRTGEKGDTGATGATGASGATGIEVTDGTTDLTGVEKITFTGATVGGASPNATVTVTGGGGGGGGGSTGPGAAVYQINASNVSTTSGTQAYMPWDMILYGDDVYLDVSHTDGLTIPAGGDGDYHIDTELLFQDGTTSTTPPWDIQFWLSIEVWRAGVRQQYLVDQDMYGSEASFSDTLRQFTLSATMPGLLAGDVVKIGWFYTNGSGPTFGFQWIDNTQSNCWVSIAPVGSSTVGIGGETRVFQGFWTSDNQGNFGRYMPYNGAAALGSADFVLLDSKFGDPSWTYADNPPGSPTGGTNLTIPTSGFYRSRLFMPVSYTAPADTSTNGKTAKFSIQLRDSYSGVESPPSGWLYNQLTVYWSSEKNSGSLSHTAQDTVEGSRLHWFAAGTTLQLYASWNGLSTTDVWQTPGGYAEFTLEYLGTSLGASL